MIGWANVALVAGRMQVATGYARRYPDSASLRRALEAELARMKRFLMTPTTGSLEPEDV